MNYLDCRNDIISDFNNRNVAELQGLERDIKMITDVYMLLFSKNPEFYLKEKSEFIILIFRSVEYLISATSLVKQRAVIEAGTVLRLCLETSSMAIHIHSDSNIFKSYKENNYKSTGSITYAKRKIEGFDELWGALSSLFVHPNTYHGIRSELIGNYIVEHGEVNLGFKPKNELQDKMMIKLLQIVANIVHRCFEIIVARKATFKGIDGLYFEECQYFAFGTSTESRIKELMQEFKNESTSRLSG
jgi:hypothetical protein